MIGRIRRRPVASTPARADSVVWTGDPGLPLRVAEGSAWAGAIAFVRDDPLRSLVWLRARSDPEAP